MTLWNHGEDHWSAFFVCPACSRTTREQAHVRNSYCPHCHDFTGEPRDFIIHGEEPPGWAECMRDKIRHGFEPGGAYARDSVRVLTDEERDAMWERNRLTFLYEQRMALTIECPPPRPRPPWHRRLRFALNRWLDGHRR